MAEEKKEARKLKVLDAGKKLSHIKAVVGGSCENSREVRQNVKRCGIIVP